MPYLVRPIRAHRRPPGIIVRSPRLFRRAAAASAVAAIAALGIAAPAHAAVPAAVSEGACVVTVADGSWGVKESFRAYISGNIARGDWQVSGDVTYDTPLFFFTGGTGDYAPETATGEVRFDGGIRFTGHGGVLDSQIDAPTLVFTGPGTAQLQADVTAVQYAAGVASEPETFERIPLIEIDLAGATVTEEGDAVTVAAVDAPTSLTAEGVPAFSSFYEAGAAFDPLTFTVTAECAPAETPTPEPAEPTEEPTAEPTETAAALPDDEEDAGPSAAPWIIAGTTGLLAIVVAITSGVAARKRRAERAAEATGDAGRGDGSDVV